MSLPAPLSARSMLYSMERLNEPLSAPFQAFLADAIADPVQHVRFLNLLSLLEHTGSRKIMLSQMCGILTQDILKHLAEETRHAFFFKREAEKLAGHSIEGYESEFTMSATAGQFYFGRLDSGLSAALPDGSHAETAYLWVSLVIELRALWVYRFYQQALIAAKYPTSLKSIIAEEDNHLEAMTERLAELGFDCESALPGAIALEKSLYERLFASLRAGLKVAA